jgi:hypothetical protein
MPNLTELLHDAAGDPPGPSDYDALERAAGARRTRRRRRNVALVVALGVIAGAVVLTRRSDGQETQRISTATTAPTTSTSAPSSFTTPTGDALIFSDGYSGVRVVDADHRLVIRRLDVGDSAGDQPFRITRVGEDLLVGWGEIFATPIDGAAPPRSIGVATTYVPAVEPDRVWLSDYPSDKPPMLQLVEVSTARVIAKVPSPSTGDAFVATGIPGGVALSTPSGIDLWQLGEQQVVAHLGSPGDGPGTVLDTRGTRIAWCTSGACQAVRVTDLADPRHPHDVFTASISGGNVFSARLSPDGTALATVSSRDGTGHVIVSTVDGDRELTTSAQYSHVQWSDDGRRLYFTEDAVVKGDTTIGLWRVDTDTIERADVPFQTATSFFVVVDASAVGSPPTTTCGAPLDGAPDCSYGF